MNVQTITRIMNNTAGKARNIPNGPFNRHLTIIQRRQGGFGQQFENFAMPHMNKTKTSFIQKVKRIFGFHSKLNPKSFADGSHTPRIAFAKSNQSIDLSNEYLRSNYLSENEKLIDGFRDAGGGAVFDHCGNIIFAKREVITIDRNADVYLRNAIDYVKQNTANMSEKKKLKFIYNVVHDISGNAEKAVEKSELMGNASAGKELLLGKIFEHGAAVCRHKSLMFKILAEEVGIKTRVLRGNAMDLGGFGRHVWNEVKLQDGSKFLVDVQNSKIVDLYAQNASKNPKLASYCNENNVPVYFKF